VVRVEASVVVLLAKVGEESSVAVSTCRFTTEAEAAAERTTTTASATVKPIRLMLKAASSGE
jgi:hypothetical protein